uniref:RING-type domain-containing protein n=1 Tax=Strongyloides venezuelensis TaxID=75913 RepID=A0A0K0F2U0_STRVS
MTFNFTCYVCLDQMNPNNMIAISCGHVLCGSCYDTMYIRRGEERVCGLCRHRFGSGLKLFLDEGTTKTSETTYQGTSTNDYLNLEKIKKLEKDLETEKCITESLEFELKEKQLEIIEQKTIALALQREIEDNHEKINRLSKKISEIEIKPTPKKVVNDPDYLWLSNDPDEDRIEIHYKQEHDNKKNDLKISNNKYNNEKKRFNEIFKRIVKRKGKETGECYEG